MTKKVVIDSDWKTVGQIFMQFYELMFICCF